VASAVPGTVTAAAAASSNAAAAPATVPRGLNSGSGGRRGR
jgi:hypothetical protein